MKLNSLNIVLRIFYILLLSAFSIPTIAVRILAQVLLRNLLTIVLSPRSGQLSVPIRWKWLRAHLLSQWLLNDTRCNFGKPLIDCIVSFLLCETLCLNHSIHVLTISLHAFTILLVLVIISFLSWCYAHGFSRWEVWWSCHFKSLMVVLRGLREHVSSTINVHLSWADIGWVN